MAEDLPVPESSQNHNLWSLRPIACSIDGVANYQETIVNSQLRPVERLAETNGVRKIDAKGREIGDPDGRRSIRCRPRRSLRRRIGDVPKRACVCVLTGRPYVVLLCVGMRDATGKCDAVWTSLCRVRIIWNTVSSVYIASGDKQTRVKRHLQVSYGRCTDGGRVGVEWLSREPRWSTRLKPGIFEILPRNGSLRIFPMQRVCSSAW